MTLMQSLVDHYSKKHPQKWAQAVERAKRKYAGKDILQMLAAEERQSLIRYRKFLEQEQVFFNKMYVKAIKSGKIEEADIFARLSQQSIT